MNKYLTEFIGTFFLVFTIGCAVIEGAGVMAPVAIGAILLAMVFAGGHVSGAHYNPAVTLAVWLRGRCDTKDVVPYMVSQVLGSTAAAFVVQFLKEGAKIDVLSPKAPLLLVAEMLFTFALAYVVLNVATSKGTSGNSFYGLAIGFTVMAGAFAVGNLSGGVFNPAVAVGITILGIGSWPNIWLYLVAQFVGAVLAAVVFKTINPADK